MVRWRRINLLADLRALGLFDVIFCRNVISAFDEPVRQRVLEQLAAALPEDGRLVLGLDETVIGVTEALQPVAGRRGLYAPNPAFRFGEKTGDPLTMYLEDIFTVSINITGLPGLSVPCGMSKTELPIGLQLIGKAFDEATLLRTAYAYEQATEWHKQKPSLKEA